MAPGGVFPADPEVLGNPYPNPVDVELRGAELDVTNGGEVSLGECTPVEFGGELEVLGKA